MPVRGIGLALLLSGCSIAVGRLNPSPMVDLAPTEQRLALTLDTAVVLDNWTLVVPGGGYTLKIDSWRSSLWAGFGNAFGDAMVPEGVRPDLTLAILEARPELTVVGRTAFMRVRYKARLLGPNGEVLRRLTGNATGQRTAGLDYNFRSAVTSAVERMYEEVAVGLFDASVSGIRVDEQN